MTVAALLRGLCPRCREGRVFKGRIAMNPRCAVCGLTFEREPGYFVAAMYISYGMALAPIVALFWLARVVAPQVSYLGSLALALLAFAPFVPAVFRYSRLLWIYIDQTIDPSR